MLPAPHRRRFGPMMDMQTLANYAWLIPTITLLAFVLILLQIWFGRAAAASPPGRPSRASQSAAYSPWSSSGRA